MKNFLYHGIITTSLLTLTACNVNQTATENQTAVDSTKIEIKQDTTPKAQVSKDTIKVEPKLVEKPSMRIVAAAVFYEGDTTKLREIEEDGFVHFDFKERYFESNFEGDSEEFSTCCYWIRKDNKILVAAFSRNLFFVPQENGSLKKGHDSCLNFYLFDPSSNKLTPIEAPIAPALDKATGKYRIDAFFPMSFDKDDIDIAYCTYYEHDYEFNSGNYAKSYTLKWNGMTFDTVK